jgi:hypothetical protein
MPGGNFSFFPAGTGVFTAGTQSSQILPDELHMYHADIHPARAFTQAVNKRSTMGGGALIFHENL